MFEVGNNILTTPPIEVLRELKAQLALNGIIRFHTIKQNGQNLQFTCPIHANGQEAKASCGVNTARIERDGKTIPPGRVHCFACGYNASIEEMVSIVFGKVDAGVFGTKWLIQNFAVYSVETRKDIILDLSRDVKPKQQNFITEEELESYRYFHPYMFKRKLTEAVIYKHDIGFDSKFTLENRFGKKQIIPSITFPVRDIDGNCLFIARRAIKQKLFHYPSEVQKPLYGLYELEHWFSNGKEIYVCESIINALTLIGWGYPAVALMGLGTTYQYKQLEQLPQRGLIIALDPDDAGRKATQRLRAAVKGKMIQELVYKDSRDINDLEEAEFGQLSTKTDWKR